VFFSASQLFAQNFYVNANAGYAFGVNGDVGVFANTTYSEIINNDIQQFTYDYNYENVPFSLGEGFNFGVGLGYMFNSNIGVELGVSYLLGSSTIGTSVGEVVRTLNQDVYLQNYEFNYTAKATMLRLIPSVVLTPGFEKFNPYARLGMIIGFGSFMMEEVDVEIMSGAYDNLQNTFTDKEKFEGGVALGVNSSLGLEYILNEQFSVLCEVNYIAMRYTPKMSSVTERMINGEDQLPILPVSTKQTEYYKEFTENGSRSAPINYDQPTQEMASSYPFSSLGLNIGVKFNF
jgi:hypothetical protein